MAVATIVANDGVIGARVLSAVWDPMRRRAMGARRGSYRAIRDGDDEQPRRVDDGGREMRRHYRWFYQGPAINANPDAAPLVDSDDGDSAGVRLVQRNGGTNRRPYGSRSCPAST